MTLNHVTEWLRMTAALTSCMTLHIFRALWAKKEEGSYQRLWIDIGNVVGPRFIGLGALKWYETWSLKHASRQADRLSSLTDRQTSRQTDRRTNGLSSSPSVHLSLSLIQESGQREKHRGAYWLLIENVELSLVLCVLIYGLICLGFLLPRFITSSWPLASRYYIALEQGTGQTVDAPLILIYAPQGSAAEPTADTDFPTDWHIIIPPPPAHHLSPRERWKDGGSVGGDWRFAAWRKREERGRKRNRRRLNKNRCCSNAKLSEL